MTADALALMTSAIDPGRRARVLARSILADGLDFVLDLDRRRARSWSTPAPASAISTCSRSSRRRRWA